MESGVANADLLFKTAQVCDPNGTGCLVAKLQMTLRSNNKNQNAAVFIPGLRWRERHTVQT